MEGQRAGVEGRTNGEGRETTQKLEEQQETMNQRKKDEEWEREPLGSINGSPTWMASPLYPSQSNMFCCLLQEDRERERERERKRERERHREEEAEK